MSRHLRVVPATEIAPAELRWLWTGLFPLGKVSVVAGLPGLGKSMLTAHLAAGVSTGTLPGHHLHTAHSVLLASAEDDPADTIVPRLVAAGAELARVGLLDMREEDPATGEAFPGVIELPGDWKAIRSAAMERNARLVVLDPIAAFLDGDHSAYNNQQVRRALAPGKSLAQDLGCAVVVVMHLNKGEARDPLSRIADSGAFTALARSVLLLGRDPDDPDGESGRRRVLTVVKSNLADDTGNGLLLEVGTKGVTTPDGEVFAPTLNVIGSTAVRAADLLDMGSEGSALAEARAFLREELADGAKPTRELQTAARDAGIAERTLRRAREMDCESVKERGKGGAWLVRLKEAKPPGPDEMAMLAALSVESAKKTKDVQGAHDPPSPEPGRLDAAREATAEEQAAYERALRIAGEAA